MAGRLLLSLSWVRPKCTGRCTRNQRDHNSTPAEHDRAPGEGFAYYGSGLKLGYLYLRNGRWEDRQIVSHAWVKDSTMKLIDIPAEYKESDERYGFLWWGPRGES